MRLAEQVERAILDGDPSTLIGRARLKTAIEARKLLIRLGDPRDLPRHLPERYIGHGGPATRTSVSGR